MIPRAAIVSGPRRRIALGSSISRARQDKGPLIALQLSQTVISRAHVFHTENIVNLRVWMFCSIVCTMNVVEGHRLCRRIENGRFVHVIPKTGCAHSDEILVERSP